MCISSTAQRYPAGLIVGGHAEGVHVVRIVSDLPRGDRRVRRLGSVVPVEDEEPSGPGHEAGDHGPGEVVAARDNRADEAALAGRDRRRGPVHVVGHDHFHGPFKEAKTAFADEARFQQLMRRAKS